MSMSRRPSGTPTTRERRSSTPASPARRRAWSLMRSPTRREACSWWRPATSPRTTTPIPSRRATSRRRTSICVAASNRTDGLASFSNHGEQSVDLAAPGVVTRSTYPFEAPDPVNETFSRWRSSSQWATGGTPDSWERTTEQTSLTGGTLTDSARTETTTRRPTTTPVFGPVDLTGESDCHLRYQLALQLDQGTILDADQLLVESLDQRRHLQHARSAYPGRQHGQANPHRRSRRRFRNAERLRAVPPNDRRRRPGRGWHPHRQPPNPLPR